jgi:hypothetical protein
MTAKASFVASSAVAAMADMGESQYSALADVLILQKTGEHSSIETDKFNY